jgi:predicted RNase H-like nuclease
VSLTVLGVDWYKRGWVAAHIGEGGLVAALTGTKLDELARVAQVTCIGVDMPIGLPRRVREADELAPHFVGCRRSSVFATPPARGT